MVFIILLSCCYGYELIRLISFIVNIHILGSHSKLGLYIMLDIIIYAVDCIMVVISMLLIRIKNKNVLLLVFMICLPILIELLFRVIIYVDLPSNSHLNIDFIFIVRFLPSHLLRSLCVALLWIPNIIYRKCSKCDFINGKSDLYCGNCGEKL